MQTESVPARVSIVTKAIAASAMDDMRKKDTFADEFGSDLLLTCLVSYFYYKL